MSPFRTSKVQALLIYLVVEAVSDPAEGSVMAMAAHL